MELYVIAVLLTVTASAASLMGLLLLWPYRSIIAVCPLLAAGAGLAWWSLAYVLQLQAYSPSQQAIWHLLKQPGALFVDVLVLLFALEQTQQQRWRSLLIVPSIALVLVFFNLGELMWRVEPVSITAFQQALVVHPQPLYWAVLIFQSGALIAAVVLLAQHERSWLPRAALIGAGGLVLLTRAGAFAIGQPFDFTPAAFAVLLALVLFVSLRVNVFYGLPHAYHTIITNHPDGVLILDQHQRVLAVNPMFTTLTGQPVELIVGAKAAEALPQLARWVPDWPTQQTCTYEVEDGHQWLEIRTLPLVDRHVVRGHALLFRDITVQKRAQEALAESETRYRTLFDQAQDAILLEDSRLAIVDANEAAVRLLGYSLSELRAMTSDVIQPYALRLETPDVKSGRFEIQAVRKDHTLLDLEVTVAPIPDGDRLLYMSILRDVTERKRTQAELKQRADELAKLYEQVSRLEQYKTEMIRMAAHDLRQPVNITMGYAELLLREGETMPQLQRERVQAILKAVARANHILSDILSLERIEQQMSHTAVERFNFRRLLGDMLAQYREPIRERQHTLHLEIDPDETPYEVVGHAPQIAEAVANLIENAIKYTPDGGQLTVRLRNNGTHLIYEVSDNGYGVPEAQQKLLFQPFSRARSPETAHIEGTGLGLHLVKTIVERHNGSVIFHSVHGQGSTFGFRLPLSRAERIIPPQALARAKRPRATATARPLLPPVD